MINESARSKAMTMLANGFDYVVIERATGINYTTIRSWADNNARGIKSLSETRKTFRHDSGQMIKIAPVCSGWDTAMGLDLLRYKFTDFPKYFMSDDE